MSAERATAFDPVLDRPVGDLDVDGRALVVTLAERDRRNLELIRALDELDDIGTPEEQRETLEEVMKAIDEYRETGRKLFS